MCSEVRGKRTVPSTPSSGYQIRRQPPRVREPRSDVGSRRCVVGCLRCLLLVMCTHPFAKEALTLHLARSEGHEHYLGCNSIHRKVLASSHQHLMAEAPDAKLGLRYNRGLVSALAIDGDGKAKPPEHSRSVSRPFEADEFRARRVQKHKRTQDWRAGTFRNRRVYAWLANGS